MWLFVYCIESKIVVEAIRYRNAVWRISNFIVNHKSFFLDPRKITWHRSKLNISVFKLFIETYFKQCKRNECIMFLKKKKKKDRERTRLSEEITTLNVTMTHHRDLTPFLLCTLFVAPLLSVSFLSRPNVVDRIRP